MAVYPSFGSLGYWHLIQVRPETKGDFSKAATPAKRAAWLCAEWAKGAGKGAGYAWPIAPQVMKAMALELVAHFGREKTDAPESLLRLLSMMLELPKAFLDDPKPMFAGGMAQGKHADPRARESAMIIDAYHRKNHRAPLAVSALQKKLQDNLKLEKPIAGATLRKWRTESDYASYVDFVGNIDWQE